MRVSGVSSTGIIPADAGSTDHLYGLEELGQDHPRGCGEHSEPSQIVHPQEGSSPRMRGARSYLLKILKRGRIIPADAGSTF